MNQQETKITLDIIIKTLKRQLPERPLSVLSRH